MFDPDDGWPPIPRLGHTWRKCNLLQAPSRGVGRRKRCPDFNDGCENLACVHGNDGEFKECNTFKLRRSEAQKWEEQETRAIIREASTMALKEVLLGERAILADEIMGAIL